MPNTIGLLLENPSNLQNTLHADFIIYKSYATCFPSGARGMWWLSHHWSITIGVCLLLNYRKTASRCLGTCFSH
jgi:hypothetical protein